jgi:hypothetical protein
MAQDCVRWRAVVNAVTNLRVLAPRSLFVCLFSDVRRSFTKIRITKFLQHKLSHRSSYRLVDSAYGQNGTRDNENSNKGRNAALSVGENGEVRESAGLALCKVLSVLNSYVVCTVVISNCFVSGNKIVDF